MCFRYPLHLQSKKINYKFEDKKSISGIYNELKEMTYTDYLKAIGGAE